MKPCVPPAKETGASDKRWRSISTLLCLLVLFSLVFVCYSAFIIPGYYRWWLCPHCAVPLYAAEAPATVVAGAPSPTTLSHVIFGIGGSVRTWNKRRSYSELWWRHGRTRGHVWLEEAPPNGTWPATSPPYRISADASRFGQRASASRMARIVAEAYRLVTAGEEEYWGEVRWFVMGDDDTVFFVDNLVAMLGKYDHEEMYYIGAPSESVEQDQLHSYAMAFGGGGFAVSAPAAAELSRVIDGCLERYAYFYGSDQRIQSCLSELGVPLTHEPGFHQVDLRGNIYGMLAAHPVAPLVSLHHLDYTEPIIPFRLNQLDALRSLVDAARFDPARILQQCFCYETAPKVFNWSVSVSWGYTVQLYPWVLAPKDLEVPLQTFKTWRSFSDGPFTFNTRPFMSDQPCEQPLLYYLKRAEGKREKDGSNTTVSVYSRNEKKDAGSCNHPGFVAALKLDTIRVFAPRMDPAVWRRASKRQCCQTRRTWWGRTLEVRIRNCRPREITSPP